MHRNEFYYALNEEEDARYMSELEANLNTAVNTLLITRFAEPRSRLAKSPQWRIETKKKNTNSITLTISDASRDNEHDRVVQRRKEAILDFLDEYLYIKESSFEIVFPSVSYRTTRRDLAELVQAGYVEKTHELYRKTSSEPTSQGQDQGKTNESSKKKVRLSPKERREIILCFAFENKWFSRSEVKEHLAGVTGRTVQRDLQYLINERLLETSGARRWTKYRI